MFNPLLLFGKTIRELRRQKGLSQEGLAELSGLHRTYIGEIERGERNVGLINVLHLAAALEVLPGELFRNFDQRSLNELPGRES